VDPGRELNGRSQQFILRVDVAGPVGPASRVPAFELILRVLSEGLEGLDAESHTNTLGKDPHAPV